MMKLLHISMHLQFNLTSYAQQRCTMRIVGVGMKATQLSLNKPPLAPLELYPTPANTLTTATMEWNLLHSVNALRAPHAMVLKQLYVCGCLSPTEWWLMLMITS